MSTIAQYTDKNIETVYADYRTGSSGLTDVDAQNRLHTYGYNQIEGKQLRWWHILWRQFNTPFIFLLLGATVLSVALREVTDGLMVLGFIIINAALGFTQEWHSEKSLKLLTQFVLPEARVCREGKEKMIPTKEVVPGDVVIIEAGDIIAADVRLFECTNLTVNETILTGESVVVSKTFDALNKPALQNYQATNSVFSGTTVVSGKAKGVVVATGKNTVLGDISRLTIETHHESSFEKGIKKFSTFILRMILIILVLLFVVNLLIKGPGNNLFELILFSVALAVSVVPEALPVVTTIALSKGAVKMAKHKVVVKRLSAVEDLGSIEVLCTDKTGTLTENTLAVQSIYGDEKETIEFGALASSFVGQQKQDPNNSFDIALWNKLTKTQQDSFSHYTKINEIPFDPERRRNSVLIKKANESQLIVRGAPETVFELCSDLTSAQKNELHAWIAAEGAEGNRVIAVAKKQSGSVDCYDVTDENQLQLVGIVSFADPIKSTARSAIIQAKKLGVAIKIITGDSVEVAEAVGRKVSLVTQAEDVATGEELEKLTEPDAQMALCEKASVFARVSPEQKLKIIELLQNKYEVGFLGEGINDAPALKMANVGIVVAGASDIAREAADIVLLQKSLGVIIGGIEEGREIFANTVKYIKTTLISNFGNFYAIAVASLLISYLPMLPVQILLLNLLSDFPMIAIATDSVDVSELKRPRSYNVREVVLIALLLGAVSTIFDFIFFATFNKHDPAVLQTNWFIGSVLTELVLIFSIRTRYFFVHGKRPATSLSILAVLATVLTFFLPLWGPTRALFKFAYPDGMHLLIVIGIVLAYFVVNETIKLLYYRRTANNSL